MKNPRLIVTCRLARPEDTPEIFELTRVIWEGHDYVAKVWEEWLADTQGCLLVAENQGKALGLSKLSRLSRWDWWMEGLRVHPQFEGRGIASQLHDATLQAWQQIGSGTLRLLTSSIRQPVQHMCARTGFVKVSEVAHFCASASRSENTTAGFEPLKLDQCDEALELIQDSASLALNAGLIDIGWQFASPRVEFLAASIERGLAWWWRSRQSVLTAWIEDDEEYGRALFVELLACHLEALPHILLDFRNLAGKFGFPQAAWMAPLNQALIPILEAAGYQRVMENSMFIYAKDHPYTPCTIR